MLPRLRRSFPPSDPQPADPSPLRLRVLEAGTVLDTVRTAATAIGLRVVVAKEWDILWSYQLPWANATVKPLLERGVGLAHDPPRLVINHLPGTVRMVSKAHLPDFVRRAGLGDAIPRSYLLPEDTKELQRRMRYEGVRDVYGWPRWIYKAKSHRGVRVLTDGSARSLAKSAPAIVQERIKPLLLRGLRRAFDVGLYVLVTSIQPLRVYAYDLSLVRFCEVDYPSSPNGFEEDPRSFVISHYAPIWSLPFFRKALKGCRDSAVCALKAELRAEGRDADLIFRRMRALAVKLLHALQPHMLAGQKRTKTHNEATFELLRFDFLVNEAGKPVLTEVNMSPSLVPAYPQDELVKSALVRDTLRIVRQRFDHTSSANGRAPPLPPGVVCEMVWIQPTSRPCCRLLDVFNTTCLSSSQLRAMRLAAAEEQAAAFGGWRRMRDL